MMKLLIPVFLIWAFESALSQPSQFCTITQEANSTLKQRMLTNRAIFQKSLKSRSGGSIYIPVRFWLTAKDDSTGRFQDYLKLFNLFCKSNECVADHSIIFYIKEIDESINNTFIHNYPFKEGKKLLNEIIKTKYDAINIVICDDVDQSLVGSTDIFSDYIIFNKIGVIEGSRALCHDLGHFLSLAHTSGAWTWYDCTKPTKDQIPFGRPVEYVSRTKEDSNGVLVCSYAADGFCDTPADYGEFNNSPSAPCIYSGCAKDLDNVKLNPNISNPMSISSYVTCFDTFTNQQKEAMYIDYLTPERDYIKVNYTPLGETKPPKYLEPVNQMKLINYDSTFFDWTDDPNSTDYILEIALNSGFTLDVKRFKTKQSQYLVTSLSPKSRYYWRVLAYNANSFCLIEPIVSIFTTGFLATSTNEEQTNKITYKVLDNININELALEFFFNEQESAYFKIFDLNGRSIRAAKIENNKLILNKNHFASGLYLLRICDSNQNAVSIKFFVQ